MAYSPFRWYTSGKYRKKPLPQSTPLLLKILHGDFEYSPFFKEADDNQKLYDEMYQDFMETSNISDLNDRKVEAHQYAKMKNVKVLKLKEKGDEEENIKLNQLRKELTSEFGKDLWDEAHKLQRGDGSTEDLYWWYKAQLGIGFTPSENAIRLGRKTTRGL